MGILLMVRDEVLALSRLVLLWPLGGHCDVLGFVWSSTRLGVVKLFSIFSLDELKRERDSD